MITIRAQEFFHLFNARAGTNPMPDTLDQQAIGSLYKEHHGWLRAWLARRIPTEAADLAQDTFVRLIASPGARSHLSALRQPRSFLATLAQRTLIDHLRRQALEQAWLETLAQRPEAHALSPEHHAIVLDTIRAFDAMLSGLGEKVRTAFLMAQLEDASYADIARELGVTVSSVKKYMARAMAHCLAYAMELP
jgi:RNA polymerase sigma-19 factor, ECF subfamily